MKQWIREGKKTNKVNVAPPPPPSPIPGDKYSGTFMNTSGC